MAPLTLPSPWRRLVSFPVKGKASANLPIGAPRTAVVMDITSPQVGSRNGFLVDNNSMTKLKDVIFSTKFPDSSTCAVSGCTSTHVGPSALPLSPQSPHDISSSIQNVTSTSFIGGSSELPSSPPIHHSGVPGNVHGTDIFSPTATITPVGGVSSSTQGNGSSTALSSSSESVLPPVITPSTGGNGPSSSSEPVLPPVITPSTASGGNGSSTVLRSSSESVLRPVITSSTGGNGPPTGLPSSSESVLRPVITPSTGGNGPSTSSEPVLQPVITPSTGAPVGPLRGGNGPIPSTFPGGDGPPSVLSIVNTHSGGNVRPTSSSLVLTTSISEDRGATPQSTSSPSASSKPVTSTEGIVRVIAGSVTDETTTTGSTVSVTSGILTFPPVRSTTSLSTSLPRPTASTQGVPGVPGVSASGRSGSSINVGALIGGCIGAAIIVLAISIFAFFYFHRRRRNEERRQTSIPAYPNPWLLQASPTPSAGSSPSPGFRPLVMETQADLPTMPMPQPTFLGVGAPLMSETSSASKLPVHRKPVPFWSSPSLDERLVNPWPTSPTSPSAHTHTMMAEDPFADPVRDSASLSDSNSTFREYGMAL